MKIIAKKLSKKTTVSKSLLILIKNGVNNVLKNSERINKLNVFPIPDGDTGTNMSSTLISGWNSIYKKKFSDYKELLTTFSKGLLMGAKGNSGIIFTQIMRGFAAGFASNQKHITTDDIITAINKAKSYAYRAVSNPVEGTMLSLIKYNSKVSTKKIKKMKSNDIQDILQIIVDDLRIALNKTPDQLKVLKQANVVDSGGYGLLAFFEGLYYGSQGIFLDSDKLRKERKVLVTTLDHTDRMNYKNAFLGYCSEIIIQLFTKYKTVSKEKITKSIQKSGGNSVVVIKDDDLLKTHIHTFKPFVQFRLLQDYGEFLKVKVDNMTLQNNHYQEIIDINSDNDFTDDTALVAIVSGKGWLKAFSDLSLDEIIYYESAKDKPNTRDILKAINSTKSKNVIIVPNSADIFLTIYESIKLAKNQNCRLIKCRNNGLAYLSCLAFDKNEQKIEQNINNMKSSMTSGKVYTFLQAVKDSLVNDVIIMKNSYISCYNNKIVESNKNLLHLLQSTIEKNINEETEILTIFKEEKYSENILKQLLSYIEDKFPILEVEIETGKLKNHAFTFIIE